MANAKVIKTNWSGTGAAKPLAEAMRTVGRTFENIRMENGGCIQKRGGRLVIPESVGGGVSFPWSKCDLGYSITSNTITMNSGTVLVGDDEYTVAEQAFTLVAPITYLGWESLYATPSAYWQNFGASPPIHDSTGLRRWLYKVECTATLNANQEYVYRLAIIRYGFLNGFAPANFDVERTV